MPHLTLKTRWFLWLLWNLGLSCFFVALATTDLPNYPPVAADEVSIMAVSYQFATTGTFGSVLDAGFFHTEDHYFDNLPMQHVWQAAVFRLFGAGVAQARWLSVAAGILLLCLVSGMGWLWFGRETAVLAPLLLLFWRTNWISTSPGIPFLTVARSARYDVTVVFCIWLAIAGLERSLQQPTVKNSIWTGVATGFATLTQFLGFFLLPVITLTALWQQWKGKTRLYWAFGAWALIILPYAGMIIIHWDDYVGQASKYRERDDFGSVVFWEQNVQREWQRYLPTMRHALRIRYGNPINPGVFLPLISLAAIVTWEHGGRNGRFLLFTLFLFLIQLGLLEQTKVALYAILLWPGICLLAASGLAQGWQWAITLPPWPRSLVHTLLLAATGWAVVDGVGVYKHDQANYVTPYLAVGQQIDAYLPPDAAILGDNRWWWALHHHAYRGIYEPFYEAIYAYQQTGQIPAFSSQIREANYILMNRNFEGDYFAYPPGFRDEFQAYLTRCTHLVADWKDVTYGRVTIHQVIERCS